MYCMALSCSLGGRSVPHPVEREKARSTPPRRFLAVWAESSRGNFRKAHDERSSLAFFAGDVDRAAELGDHDVVDDGEPETGALSERLGREHGVEDLCQVLGADAGSVVGNAKLGAIV